MKTKLAKSKHVAILFIGISAASVPMMASADWTLIKLDLGPLATFESFAHGINDSGQVVGTAYETGTSGRAFITGANGIGVTYLGDDSAAWDINDSGQVVGDFLSGSNAHPFITGANGVGMIDLDTLGGEFGSPRGINNSGQVVGSAYTAAPDIHAFVTGANGADMTDLGTLNGREHSMATGINDSGQVVGTAVNSRFDDARAFITGTNGVGMIDLGTLGGKESRASGINDSGQVVGTSDAALGAQAFITGANGTGMTNLGTLGGEFSSASSINDSGEVVGSAHTATGDSHPFIFSHGGMTDLTLLAPVVAAGWGTNFVITDINNNGQMVGWGKQPGHEPEAFLLSYSPDTVFTPNPIFIPTIPEPNTYAMLLIGLGLMGFMARCRKQNT